MDPRVSLDDFDDFNGAIRREWVKDPDVITMLSDPSIASFTVIQHVNQGGEYHRFLWPRPSTDSWYQYIGDWGHSPLKDWAPKMLDIVDGMLYGGVFKAKKIDPDGFHVTFHRV